MICQAGPVDVRDKARSSDWNPEKLLYFLSPNWAQMKVPVFILASVRFEGDLILDEPQ